MFSFLCSLFYLAAAQTASKLVVFNVKNPRGDRSVLYLFLQFPVFSLHSLRNIFYYNIGKLVFKASSLLSKNMKKE